MKLSKTLKKLQKTHKQFKKFIECVKKIWLSCFIVLVFCMCHSTRASVRNEADGATTTITITTSNPTKTDIAPSVNLEKGK